MYPHAHRVSQEKAGRHTGWELNGVFIETHSLKFKHLNMTLCKRDQLETFQIELQMFGCTKQHYSQGVLGTVLSLSRRWLPTQLQFSKSLAWCAGRCAGSQLMPAASIYKWNEREKRDDGHFWRKHESVTDETRYARYAVVKRLQYDSALMGADETQSYCNMIISFWIVHNVPRSYWDDLQTKPQIQNSLKSHFLRNTSILETRLWKHKIPWDKLSTLKPFCSLWSGQCEPAICIPIETACKTCNVHIIEHSLKFYF